MPNNIRWYALGLFLTLLTVLISLYFAQYEHKKTIPDTVHTPVVWQAYSRSSGSPALYKLSSKDEKNEFFISSLSPISDATVALEEGWSLYQIDSDVFWDPTACAKMPSVRIGNSIFFKEVTIEKETRKFSHAIIRYDIQTNSLTVIDLTNENTVGDLYKDGESLFYFTRSGDDLVVHTLEGPDFNLDRQDIVVIPDTVPFDNLVLYYDNLHRVYFSYFDVTMNEVSYIYNPRNISFSITDTVNRVHSTEIIGMQKFVHLKSSDFLVEYGISDVYEVRILDSEKNTVATFDSQGNIIKYVIDPY